jgi:hypothetical protein
MNKICIIILAGFSVFGSSARSAILLDLFSAGNFDVQNVRSAPLVVPNSDSIWRLRSTDWLGGLTEAYMTQDASQGSLKLRVALREEPNPRLDFKFSLNYFNDSGGMDLLGNTHALIRISSLTGRGDIATTYQGIASDVLYSLSLPGEYLVPLQGIPAGLNPSNFGFNFYVRSADFSVTIDEIVLVPEPSVFGLVSLVGIAIISRRKRNSDTYSLRLQVDASGFYSAQA